MISRDLKLTINNNSATLNEPVTVYMYDRGIQLNIDVFEYKFKTGRTVNGSYIENHNIYKASAIIKSPDGKVFKYPTVKAEIVDNRVHILITKEWTDESDEAGKYYIQIQLYDDEGSRVSLPPFYITVEKLIFPYDDNHDGDTSGYTDVSGFDSSFIGAEGSITDNSKLSEGFYDRTTWIQNMLISSSGLNKLENRLEEIYSGQGLEETEISSYNTTSKTTVGAINELKALFSTLQSEINDFIINNSGIPGTGGGTKDVPIESINILNNALTLVPGSTPVSLTCTVTPSNYTEDLVWTTGDDSIAIVDSTGKVFAVGTGTTTVTCKSSGDANINDSITITVNAESTLVPITGITLTTDKETFDIDVPVQIDCVVTPTNYTSKLIWISSNTEIATVDQFGVVTPKKTGDVVITCRSSSNKEIFCNLTITVMNTYIPLQSITLNPTSLSVNIDDVFKIGYVLTPSNTTEDGLYWYSEDQSIATVDQKGIVTGVGAGTTTIRCVSTINNEIFASCEVKSVVAIKDVEILQTSNKIEKGTTQQLQVEYMPNNTNQRELIWTSSDESIATVDQNGLVTALKAGNVTIKCASEYNNEIYDECSKDIVVYIADIESTVLINELDKNSSFQLDYKLYPDDITEKELIWTSSDESIATVDRNGLVTAINTGNVTIRCTSEYNNKIYEEWNITVPVLLPEQIIISDMGFDLCINETKKVIYSFIPLKTTEKELIWTSSDESIATVDQNGLVTAINAGNVTIRCTSKAAPDVSQELNINIRKGIIEILTTLDRVDSGLSYQIDAAFRPSESEIVWSVSNNSLANIDENGLLTVFGTEGSFDIVCSFKDEPTVFDAINTTINVYATGIIINGGNDVYKNANQSNTYTLDYILLPESCNVDITADNISYPNDVTYDMETKTFTFYNNGNYEIVISNENFSSIINVHFVEYDVIFLSNSNTPAFNVNGIKKEEATILNRLGDNYVYGYKNSNITSLDFIAYGNDGFTTSNTDLLQIFFINTEKLTTMKRMFYQCINLSSIDGIKEWDTSNVTDMSNMFFNCDSLTSLDLSGWDTSNVTIIQHMFSNCDSLTSLDLSRWDTSKVTNMNSTFFNSQKLNSIEGISYWDTNEVKDMNAMFSNCQSLTSLNLSGWDTSNVTDMGYMFSGVNYSDYPSETPILSKLTSLNLSGWDTSKVTYIFGILKYLPSLKYITCDNAATINKIAPELTIRTSEDPGIFYYDGDIGSVDVLLLKDKNWVISGDLEELYPAIYFDISELNIPRGEYFIIHANINSNAISTDVTWETKESDLEFITVEPDGMYCKIYAKKQGESIIRCYYTDYPLQYSDLKINVLAVPESIVLSTLSSEDFPFYIGETRQIHYNILPYETTFKDVIWSSSDESIATVDQNGLVTAIKAGNVTIKCTSEYNSIFSTINFNIKSEYINFIDDLPNRLDKGESYKLTISTNPQNSDITWSSSDENIATVDQNGLVTIVGDSGSFFIRCALKNDQNIFIESNQCTVNVYVTELEIVNSKSITIPKGYYDDHDIIIEYKLLPDNYNVEFDTSEIKAQLYNCETNEFINGTYLEKNDDKFIFNFNKSGINEDKISVKVYYNFDSIYDIVDITRKEVDITFSSKGDKRLYMLDSVNHPDTSVSIEDDVFELGSYNDNNLYGYIYPDELIDKIEYIGFNRLTKVYTDDGKYSLVSTAVNTDLVNVLKLDLTKLKNLKFMTSMFSSCSSLESVNLSDCNNSNVTNMSRMFNRCHKLKTLDLTSFDTSNVIDMGYMFQECNNLEEIYAANWDTSNVISMRGMFYACHRIGKIEGISNWDTSNVIFMDYMFYNCLHNLLSLDLSGWDTSNVADMSYMFACNDSFTSHGITSINLSRWNTINVISMRGMFRNCRRLKTITSTNWKVSKVIDMGYMFYWCIKLETVNIDSWNTNTVTDMDYMFYKCMKLTNYINPNKFWDNKNVKYHDCCFTDCTALENWTSVNYNWK